MIKRLFMFLFSFWIVLHVMSGCQKAGEEKQVSQATAEQETRTHVASSNAEVTDFDDVWVLFADWGPEHFKEARELFKKNNLDGSAQRLRKGAAYLELQVLRAEGLSKYALKDYARELRSIARYMESGRSFPVRTLDKFFADIHQTLASFHQQKAEKAYAQKRFKAAGYELKAATDNLELIAFWAGQPLGSASTDPIREGRIAASKLENGSELDQTQIENALKKTGDHIERLGKKSETENVWTMYQDEAESHFQRAKETFSRKDYKTAAANIRMAGACVALESLRGVGEQKTELQSVSENLNRLADEIEAGRFHSQEILKGVFARSQYALALHHWGRASRAWSSKNPKQAAEAMRTAAMVAEKALTWEGKEIKGNTAQVFKETREHARKVIEGKDWKSGKMSDSISRLGKELEKRNRLSDNKR